MNEQEIKDHLSLLTHMERITEQKIQDAIEKHEMANAQTLTTIAIRLDAIVAQIAKLEQMTREGFPHGDPVSHRKVHEAYIQEAQERAATWGEVKTKLITGGLWAVLAFVCASIWLNIKEHLK